VILNAGKSCKVCREIGYKWSKQRKSENLYRKEMRRHFFFFCFVFFFSSLQSIMTLFNTILLLTGQICVVVSSAAFPAFGSLLTEWWNTVSFKRSEHLYNTNKIQYLMPPRYCKSYLKLPCHLASADVIALHLSHHFVLGVKLFTCFKSVTQWEVSLHEQTCKMTQNFPIAYLFVGSFAALPCS